MGQLLQQVVDAIQQSVYHQSLTLELAPGVEQAWVSGDEVRLVQVFNNLLVNAIKFTPAGGTIRVQAAVEGDEVRVDVVDSGVGVPQEELHRIFELFYQAPQKSDRARGGLGLGLPIVRSLVEMHGGTVHASSEGLGQGCRMTVRLPQCEAPAPSEIAAPAPETRGAGRILVVDDNEDAADTCAALLEMSGYVVRVAYTPDSALATLGEFTPDVAILDIGLPGMSGHELASRMKAPPYNYEGRAGGADRLRAGRRHRHLGGRGIRRPPHQARSPFHFAEAAGRTDAARTPGRLKPSSAMSAPAPAAPGSGPQWASKRWMP